ncbi:MAG: FprA family A-type flavoprotein [Prevotellaceae bacterium]|jgi:flavorubredoxin|nr:FprA family A-type flavoprotein [Prevotellaceae bacterium]
MNIRIPVSGSVSWIGANDRRKALFENVWPLPNGITYNAYIIDDEKTALIDTVDASASGDFLERIEAQLQGRQLQYIVVNHMEPDHSGMIDALTKRYPELRIVGNRRTFKVLESYFGITRNLVEVSDGDRLELGHHSLRFIMTPWVHWPETMMTYDASEQMLFSGDAFGAFGAFNGGIFDDEVHLEEWEDEARRYFSNIVGQYSAMVQKALAKLKGVPLRIICPTHGLVWRSKPSVIIDLYDRWSRYDARPGLLIAFASMYGNAEQMADYLARRIAEHGIRDIRVCDVSTTHLSFLLSEIWKYRAVMLGSCTYNNLLHPLMEQLCSKLTHIAPKNRIAGAFGTFSWNGGAVKIIRQTYEALGWPLVAEAVEIHGHPTPEKLTACDALALAMATADALTHHP